MPALFVFLLKVNIALVVFCLGYYLVLRKLTFYTLNRYYLILGIIFSSVYPFVNVDSFFEQHKQLATIQQVVIELKTPAKNLLANAWYWNWASVLFWVGAAFFAMRLIIQFISLNKVYHNSTPDTLHQYQVRITDADISPFSFWRSIFINPENIETADLKNILQHEQVHINQWHTFDILLAEVSVIFYWFNPGVWFMKRAVGENLEFITDRSLLQNGMDSKNYQYSLLNVSLGTNTSPNITNHFNFSTLKTRIKMMNTKKSSTLNLTRYALLVPVMIACLCVFSISKAEIIGQSNVAYKILTSTVKQMVYGTIDEVTIHPATALNDTTKKKIKVEKIYVIKSDSANNKDTFVIVSDSASQLKRTGNKDIKRVVFISRLDKDSARINSFVIDGKELTPDEVKANSPASIKSITVIARKDKDSTTIKSYVINGKEATADELKKIKPASIQNIRIKTDSTGKKDKIIQITTKE